MILLCSGQIQRKHFDAVLLFAQQLDRRGHQVAIDPRFVPLDVTKQAKYEMAPFLAEYDDVSADRVIIIGAEAIAEEVQIILGSMRLEEDVPVWALGNFSNLQNQINAANKIAYAIGREPHLLDLNAHQRPALHEDAITPFATALCATPAQAEDDGCRILIYVPGEDLVRKKGLLNQIGAIGQSANTTLHVITNARGKDAVHKAQNVSMSVFGYAELPPLDMLNYFDVLILCGAKVQGERMAWLALNAMGAGKVVVDATTSGALCANGAPALAGPSDASGLLWYVQETLLRNRIEIGRRTQESNWLKQFDVTGLEHALGLTPPAVTPKNTAPQTVFFPTNGNGMGHAQRCALIAEAMTPGRNRSFAAFPSCVDTLLNRGFPCTPMISRTRNHGVEYAADTLNYLRLRSLLKPGDQLVFDGGYVFDSVYRLISNLNAPAIWIRRGLWQASQVNAVALERERAFSKIIVPTEAFAELNTDYSTGHHVTHVGPIVRQGKPDETLRDRLGDHFKRQIDTLVMTMLGGGVASERTVQTQLLCSLLEERPNCLHLVVAWPHAVVASGLYGWQNTRVIQTSRPLDLCQASDLCISAAGYNSFHELMYAQIPAIFIPQSAPYLDDQERRAQSAFERGLAGLVDPLDLLTLEREVTAFLDGGKADQVKAALSTATLPEPGNAAAASIIEEGVTG